VTMREIKDLKEMRLFSEKAKSHGKKVGFVPTMGALHEGHLALVEAARRQCDIVVVSIFVNPTQFSPNEDLSRYPRNIRRDKNQLKHFDVEVLFIPDADAIYPGGYKTYVEVEKLSKKLCGRSRPAHFRGVATIVAKLFNIVAPDVAFFGEKDYQQLLIIRQLTRDLNWPIKIVPVPTVREFNGLAMSSRNAYLTAKEKKSATILYRALCLAKTEIEGGGKDMSRIIFRMRSLIGTEPGINLDYLLAVDPTSLEEARSVKGKILFVLAAQVGKARLIDNLVVDAG